MERAFFSSRKNWLTGACLSNRHSHSKGAALLSRQKMHFVSMVSIPLKQLKQVTFRGNITIHFDEVVSVVSLHYTHVNMSNNERITIG